MRRLAALLLATATAASANPFELFGYTPRGLGLGGAMTAVGDDLSAGFYNPAGLLGHSKTEFGIGFADTISNLYIDRSKTSIGSSAVEKAPRFELGLIFPLGGSLLKDRVVIGISGGHPMGSLIRVQTVDQSHPQFYMYQSKPQRFALATSVGVKIVNGLSVGVGAQIIAEQVGSVNFQLDVASRQFAARDITVDLNTIPEPLAGILIEPTDSLKIGFSWRKEAQLYYAQPTTIDLGNDVGALDLNVHGLAQYWPHVFSGGVTWKATRRLMLAFQVDYLLWSKAPNDQVTVAMTARNGIFAGFGLDSLLNTTSEDAKMGFSNIAQPRVGAEWDVTDHLTVRAGGYYRPPVTPDQTGSTNYLDNQTVSLNAGASYKFGDPLKVFSDLVTLDVGGGVIYALERTATKKQVADATGSSTYGGQLYSFSAMLRYLY